MPISNGTYSRGRQAKVKGKVEQAEKNKMRYTKAKYSIRFRDSGIEFEKEIKKG